MTTGIMIQYRKDGPISFLSFSGEVDQTMLQKDFSEAQSLLGDFKEVVLLFDLSGVPYINSGFIGQVSELYSLVDENAGKMVILGNPVINDTFDLVGFGEFVMITPSKEQALTALRNFLETKSFDFQFTD